MSERREVEGLRSILLAETKYFRKFGLHEAGYFETQVGVCRKNRVKKSRRSSLYGEGKSDEEVLLYGG
jgi:hypothetical protein